MIPASRRSLKALAADETNGLRHISWCRAEDDYLGLNVIEPRIVQCREGGGCERSRLDHQAVDSCTQIVKSQVELVHRVHPGQGANASTEIAATSTHTISAIETSKSMMFILK